MVKTSVRALRPWLFSDREAVYDAFAFNVWDFEIASEGDWERALSMQTYRRFCNPKYAMSEYGIQEDVTSATASMLVCSHVPDRSPKESLT